MEELSFIDKNITFRGIDYEFEYTEKIDDMCVHVHMGGQIIALLGDQTTINGIKMTNADDIINTLI